ncbi:MAG TPA: DUF2568 domain-containing protein [Aggregatilineaceae bacterium]|nr:DUF2568 domain-containing protein [Aggregatilineaceae bacterium]
MGLDRTPRTLASGARAEFAARRRILWGTFRVPGDPKDAPVPVPGPVRLLLELVLFAAAVWLLAAADQPSLAAVLRVLVVLHYTASYDRIRWLLTRR